MYVLLAFVSFIDPDWLILVHDFSNAFALAKLKTIRVVRITIDTRLSHSRLNVPWLARILESCPNTLTQLCIQMKMWLIGNIYNSAIDWEPLRNVVTTETFPALANFQLGLECIEARGETVVQLTQGLVDAARDKFQHLQNQGILDCAVMKWTESFF